MSYERHINNVLEGKYGILKGYPITVAIAVTVEGITYKVQVKELRCYSWI